MIEVGDIVVTLPSRHWSPGYSHGMLGLIMSDREETANQTLVLFLAPEAWFAPDEPKFCTSDSVMAVDGLSCPIPPRSYCAGCDKPFWELDYLCKDCQP